MTLKIKLILEIILEILKQEWAVQISKQITNLMIGMHITIMKGINLTIF